MIRVVAVLVCLSAFVLGQRNGLLDGVANLSDAVSRRVLSADRSGGNADWVEVKAKSTVTLADIHGAVSIRHILVHDQLAQSLSFARAGAPDVLGWRNRAERGSSYRRFLRNRVRVRRCSGRTSRPEIPILVVLAHHRAGSRHELLLRDAIWKWSAGHLDQ
jgi:hypothetical protein